MYLYNAHHAVFPFARMITVCVCAGARGVNRASRGVGSSVA